MGAAHSNASHEQRTPGQQQQKHHHHPSSILFTTSDGSVGLTHEFVQQYVRHMPFEVKQPVLTRRHVRLIEANWTLISRGTSSAYDETRHGNPDKFFHRTYYSLLFAVMPSCRSIFRSSMHLQGKSLFAILRAMTSILHCPDIVDRMQALAGRHLTYGCEKTDYTTAGVTLLKTLEIVSGDQWNYDVKEAYLTAFCLLMYLMLPVIVHNPPAAVTDSVVATITAIKVGQHSQHHHQQKATPTPHLVDHPKRKTRRITLTHAFPLRFLPGDGVILGIPVLDQPSQPQSLDAPVSGQPSNPLLSTSRQSSKPPQQRTSMVKQYFPIASYRPHASNSLDIYVHDDTTGAHHPWFHSVQSQTIGNADLRLYWVESDHHFEVDDVPKLPKSVLFVSYGLGLAPFMAMLQALHSVRQTYDGHVVVLHCAATLEDAEADLSLAASSVAEIRQWPQCSIQCGTPDAMLPLISLVPNPQQAQHLYVCGPPSFVDATQDTFTQAGGLAQHVHVSYYDMYNGMVDGERVPTPKHPSDGGDKLAGVWNRRRTNNGDPNRVVP
ncbi:hypothetical protein DYB25_003688 [Aphanomyces astaci]|uniref:Nitric oxide dioxygenase n=4 Tax=Aphanomyces astaci TaxID=112090 RepID=A0A397CK39_APHAT|nr:hypothetical protein DYB25_003688 [Aphanomyces astaci]RHY44979.1 hypothetical protein DYB38_003530 [Aphanomyces astaci]RHY62556.1 hypothetical protein DYB34_004904 [Aphanomyces astaci]RHY78939.1 hypothetical protein DYB30_006155 [Aphanomyces astaci]RHY97992.1 hypothetical protein DYB31_005078 [Aphanomyces astaci]